MSLIIKLRQDEMLVRVLRNSTHLFSSNSISLVLSFVQGILAARLLGPSGFGLVGIVMSFAATLNGLLSFRMSELVVRYGGEFLEKGETRKAAAVIKAAGLAESGVSVLAFLLVALTAGLGARFIAKVPGSEWMFTLYALGLLANFNTETSTGVLQITDRIRVRGTVNLIQSAVSALIIVVAFVWSTHGAVAAPMAIVTVLLSYLVGKAILGIGLFVAAQARLRQMLGPNWSEVPFSVLPSLSDLFRFALSANLSATAILIFRESELLWVGFFLNTEAAGLYKIAYTIVNFLSVPADPLILSVYPETNRLIVQKAWGRLRDFLRKMTTFSFAYNLVLALGLVVFGRLVLGIFGMQYIPAYPALLALLAGLAFNYTLFWNRPLLLSLGLPAFALWAILVAGALKVGLALWLVPRYGYVMEAALLSLYYVLSVSLIVWRALTELGRRQALARGIG
jgi:O-antigen/teichoic acid export membrane protein